MNLDQIETKCFILALFIRDDGERFLLGSRAYEFVDSQLHFTANAYQNDIVEVQGNDGVMLAGQVRRGQSQAFDGYIGDSSVDRSTIEQYRQNFLKFFRKNHYYKVVYIFTDGSAIQRRQGFIVEAPEVKELYQLFPQYHISMNFEDINYYEYKEDEDGQEIYGESATLKVATSATGGLIWENGSQTTLSGEGSNFTLNGTIDGNAISNAQLKGDTSQQTYSGKNLFNVFDILSSSNVTVDSEGWLTCTVDNTSGSSYMYGTYFTNNLVALQPSTAYAIVMEVKSVSGSGTVYPTQGSSSLSQFTSNIAVDFSNVVAGGVYIYTQSTKSSFSGTTQGLRNAIAFAAGQSGSITFRMSVLADTTITPSTFSYEPYVGGIPAPNPDYPQAVNTVTGEQTITVSDGGGNSQNYNIDLGNIELCKIGDYQDYIYNSGDDWYVHKAIEKTILGQNEVESNWYTVGSTQKVFAKRTRMGAYSTSVRYIMSDMYIGVARDNIGSNTICLTNDGDFRFDTLNTYTKADFLTFIASNNVTAYYVLPIATDVQITNTALIAQLDALAGATTYDGQTVFTVTSENQLGILSLSSLVIAGGGVAWDSYGAEWEEGTGGGPTMISVDSIDNVYPVWELTGPAVNPQISVLTTNTTLTYTGSITASQTLSIDMFNKTATLNGTSVIGNVSGDWVYLKPGINRVTYTTNNADAPDSTIWWQEIVG